MTEYDPALDAYRSWQLAIAEIRKRGVIEGRFQPVGEKEKAMKEAGCEG